MSADNELAPSAADWDTRGWTSIEPVLAEHFVAEHHWREKPESTLWFGGRNAGFDVSNALRRTDAKKAWFNVGDDEYLYFAAPKNGFNPDKVDAIAPVVLSGVSIGYEVCPSGGGKVIGRYESARMWLIPVTELNSMLQYQAKGRSRVPLALLFPYEQD